MTKPAKTSSAAARRKGARRIAEIPRDVLRALNEGRDETITLVEWLAIDQAELFSHVLPELGFGREPTAAMVAHARSLAGEGVTVRVREAGARLHALLAGEPSRRREQRFEAFACHGSDMVRGVAAYAIGADPGLDLEQRLARSRRFAADRATSVRECAWDSFRPWIALELPRALALLVPWVRARDPNLRRCAIEATRPRGVWTRHLEALKRDPAPGLVLLDPCRSDPSDYVRRAVANWLNDASKSRPAWVQRVGARWSRASKTPETAWIVARALRTLRRSESLPE